MFVSIVIISFSLMLFLYWFRYTCLLILNTKTTKDYTIQVAKANQLQFPAIQDQLRAVTDTGRMSGIADSGPALAMDSLQKSLERDYRLLTGLLRHAAQFQVGGVNMEQRMLMIDYQVMKTWYAVARRFSKAGHAAEALQEMADIVAHFANAMGERSAASSRG
jgi:hypothetical protein